MELIIAILSILISIITLWLTYLHRGTVKMTRPTIIAFAFEGYRRDEPKLFLRTLLYCTSKQNVVVESLFVKLTHASQSKTFSVWAYGDGGLVRGSGISVGEQGIEVYHHFLTPESISGYKFSPGKYSFEIYAIIRGKRKRLYELQLELSEEMAERLDQQIVNVFFDWNPEANKYSSRFQHANEMQNVNLFYNS